MGNADSKLEKHIEKQLNLDDMYCEIFANKAGAKVLEDLYEFCGKDALCIGKDENETYLMLGSRSVALYIKDRMDRKFAKNYEKQKKKDLDYRGK